MLSPVRAFILRVGPAKLFGADVIDVRSGGAHGNNAEALPRREDRCLPVPVNKRLSFENYEPTDAVHGWVGVCQSLQIPLAYEVYYCRFNLRESGSIDRVMIVPRHGDSSRRSNRRGSGEACAISLEDLGSVADRSRF